METIDGVHHINIYSKGKTEIGRWLSNLAILLYKLKMVTLNLLKGIGIGLQL